MLMTRRLEPPQRGILYHYCGTASFEAIVKSRRIRFSDVNQLNDYAEGRWGYKVFEQAATKLLTTKPPGLPGLDKAFFDRVDEILSSHQLIAHPLIACFSREPDVLSQWRGYADDGVGFAIGFAGQLLANLGVTLLEVLYDHTAQIDEMTVALGAIFLESQEKGFGSNFFESVLMLATYSYAFKNPAFREEREVRAVRLVNPIESGGGVGFVDPGGMAEQDAKIVPSAILQFRTRNNALVPFVDLPLGDGAIKEIWLGPKNVNRASNVTLMLGTLGIGPVSMRRSAATYR